MTRFGSPWDRRLKIATALILVLLLALGAGIPLLAGRDAPELRPALAAVPALFLLVSLACWALAPRAFALEAGQLVVERPFLPVRIPLASIRSVRLLPADALRGCLRTAGTAGFFGNYGRFWSRALGAFRMYATSSSRLVLVQAHGGPFVLSPHPPERFVEALRARAPRAAGEPALPAPGPMPRRVWLPLALGAGLVPLAVAAVLGGSWAFGPRAIALEADAIRIDRNAVGSIRVPLASIRSTRPVGREDFRGWRRTSGVAMGALAYGRFRSEALGPFQLYAFRRGPLVLLETDGGRVVLSPEDPERFLADLRARLVSPPTQAR